MKVIFLASLFALYLGAQGESNSRTEQLAGSASKPCTDLLKGIILRNQELYRSSLADTRAESVAKFSQEMTDAARDLFVATSTSFRERKINNKTSFLILPGPSRLGRLATMLREKYHTRLIYIPQEMLEQRYGGNTYLEYRGTRPILTLFIGIRSLMDQGPIELDPDIQHEIGHIDTLFGLVKRLRSGYYGFVKVLHGQLPNFGYPDADHYQNTFLFDEMKTFLLTILTGAQRLRAKLEATRQPDEKIANEGMSWDWLEYHGRISKTVQAIANAVANQSVPSSIHQGYYDSKIFFIRYYGIKIEDATTEVQFPLTTITKASSQTRIQQAISGEINLLRSVADRHVRAQAELEKLFEDLRSTKDTKQKISILDQIILACQTPKLF